MIVWRRQALDDLASAVAYVAERNPAAAERLYLTLRAAVERLSIHPSLGRAGRVPRTRELIVAGTSYVIPYTVHAGDLIILRVIHGAQEWPGSFEE